MAIGSAGGSAGGAAGWWEVKKRRHPHEGIARGGGASRPARGKAVLALSLKAELDSGDTAEVIVAFAEENPLKGSEQGGFGRDGG